MVSVSSDIPEEWERRWESDFELNADLHLPAENRFIGQSAFSWRAVPAQFRNLEWPDHCLMLLEAWS